jgi:hypothetical protein
VTAVFPDLEMVRTSDADRYQDLDVRVAEVLLERLVSRPVKRQILDVFFSDEIVSLRPELIRVAFCQRDDLSTDLWFEYFKIVLIILEVFIPVDFFPPVSYTEKSDGNEFAVLSV